jgi:hypothetical protein
MSRAPELSRRRLFGLAAAGLLPVAACSRTGATPDVAAGAPSAAASESAAAAPVSFPWAGKGPVPGTPGRALLGAYLDLKGQTLTQALTLRKQQLGRDPRILHYFYAWKDDLPSEYPGFPADTYPMVSWRGGDYVAINNGSFDAHLKANARALAKYGKPILLRWAWEMNGDWYTWGGPRQNRDIAGFIAAWRRVHRVFRAEGAGQVSFVWGPNWNSRPAEPWNDLNNYYPGDDVVDWVGVSGYPHDKEPAETLFGPMYRTYTARKPMMLAEVAAIDHGGRTKADWTTRLDRWVREHPAIAAMLWFDTDTHPWSTENFRIDSSPEMLQAYQVLAKDPRFAA